MKNTLLPDRLDDRKITVTERLLSFINQKGVSRNAFYARTGIGNGAIDKKGGMNSSSIEKVLEEFPDLNLYWLITGKKDKQGAAIVDIESDKSSELLDAYRKITQLREKLDKAEEELENANQELRLKDAQIIEITKNLMDAKNKKNIA